MKQEYASRYELTKAWGQTVIVETPAGAGSILAVDAVAKWEGHTGE